MTLSINKGQTKKVRIPVSKSNGYSTATTFSVSGVPIGVNVTFEPMSTTGEGNLDLIATITVGAFALSGNHTLVFSGTPPPVNNSQIPISIPEGTTWFPFPTTGSPQNTTSPQPDTSTWDINAIKRDGVNGDSYPDTFYFSWSARGGVPQGSTASITANGQTFSGYSGSITLNSRQEVTITASLTFPTDSYDNYQTLTKTIKVWSS